MEWPIRLSPEVNRFTCPIHSRSGDEIGRGMASSSPDTVGSKPDHRDARGPASREPARELASAAVFQDALHELGILWQESRRRQARGQNAPSWLLGEDLAQDG